MKKGWLSKGNGYQNWYENNNTSLKAFCRYFGPCNNFPVRVYAKYCLTNTTNALVL